MTVRRSTRKKPAEPANGDLKEETSPTGHLLPAGPEEKKKWQGFCEIESEPVSRWQPEVAYRNANSEGRPFSMSCSKILASEV